ncbi:MAG: addiction module antidote protein, HigA family [Lachnospiraceae bacterium]|nr:addiction module antidote protein, HigA family [Lachnospiraceae bacterium]
MKRRPTHPGVVFREDVMKSMNMSVTETAKMLGVSRKTLSEFINEKTALSPQMALRIAKATNTSAESWLNMQQKLTLWDAMQNEPNNVIPFPTQTAMEG